MNNYIESETIPLVAEDEEELPGLQDVPSSHEEEDAISDELAVGIEEQEESPSLDAIAISHEEEFATEYDSSEDSDLYSTQQETIPDEPTSDIEAKLEGAKDHVSQITNILEEIEELPGLQDVPVSSKEEQKQHSELRTYEMNNYIESETIPLVAEDEEELPGLQDVPSSHEEEFATEYDSSEDSDLYSTQQETIPDEPTSDIEAKLEATQDHVSQITNILEEIEELPELQDLPSSTEEDKEEDAIPDELAVGIEEEQEEIEESPSLDAMPISHEEDNEINPSEDSLDSEDVEASLEATQDHVSQITNILEEIEELPELQDVPSSHEAGEEIDSLGDTIPDELAVGIEEEQEEIEESPSLDAMPISHEEDEEIDSLEDASDAGLYPIEEDAIYDKLAVGIEEEQEENRRITKLRCYANLS